MTVYETTATLGPGRHAFSWFPDADDRAAHVPDPARRHRRLEQPAHATARATPRPAGGRRRPVIRVLGVDAGFTRESYVPGETATLRVETDASALSLQVFRAGAGGRARPTTTR